MFALSFRSQHSRNRQRSNSCRPRIEWMEPRTLLSAVSWTGGGGDNNWDTAANWNTDSVPGSGDDVTIAIAANVAHSNAVTDSIQSLTSTRTADDLGRHALDRLGVDDRRHPDDQRRHPDGRRRRERRRPRDPHLRHALRLGALDANGGMLINPGVVPGGIFSLDGRTVNNAAGQTATWGGNPSNSSDINASDGSVFNNLGTFLVESLGLYAGDGRRRPLHVQQRGEHHRQRDRNRRDRGVVPDDRRLRQHPVEWPNRFHASKCEPGRGVRRRIERGRSSSSAHSPSTRPRPSPAVVHWSWTDPRCYRRTTLSRVRLRSEARCRSTAR